MIVKERFANLNHEPLRFHQLDQLIMPLAGLQFMELHRDLLDTAPMLVGKGSKNFVLAAFAIDLEVVDCLQVQLVHDGAQRDARRPDMYGFKLLLQKK